MKVLMSKRFVLTLLAIAALFVGLLFVTKKDASAPTNNGDNNNNASQLTNHTYGEGKKGVTLIEYGDFQCPACGAYEPIVHQLREKYKSDITFQFRHFPLTEIHQNALIAARSAEAAGMQNRFWEMHDLIYENQRAWESSPNAGKIFEDYATQLGLNLDKFREDVKSDATNRAVQADRNEAKRLGFSSTPTFVLNGQKLEQNPRDADAFDKLIADAIKAKQASQSN
jgi:protein-disulfide isomerase